MQKSERDGYGHAYYRNSYAYSKPREGYEYTQAEIQNSYQKNSKNITQSRTILDEAKAVNRLIPTTATITSTMATGLIRPPTKSIGRVLRQTVSSAHALQIEMITTIIGAMTDVKTSSVVMTTATKTSTPLSFALTIEITMISAKAMLDAMSLISCEFLKLARQEN